MYWVHGRELDVTHDHSAIRGLRARSTSEHGAGAQGVGDSRWGIGAWRSRKPHRANGLTGDLLLLLLPPLFTILSRN